MTTTIHINPARVSFVGPAREGRYEAAGGGLSATVSMIIDGVSMPFSFTGRDSLENCTAFRDAIAYQAQDRTDRLVAFSVDILT